MPGVAQLEGDLVFEGEGFVEFEAPGEIIDAIFQVLDLFVGSLGKGHGIAEHRQQQGLGGMGADDLAFKACIDQIRYPADMINMGMGQKQIADVGRRHGELCKRQFRVISVGGAAVHQDIDASGGTRMGFYEVAGTGDAFFGAEMGYFHKISLY